MTDINKVVLIGRVTKDVGSDERSYGTLPSGTTKAVVSIAVNRSVKKNDQWEEVASFFDVTIFGKSAENLKQYLTKGTRIGVEGSLRQDRWEKDGKKQSKVYIVADSVQLLGGKNGDGSSSNYTKSASSGSAPSSGGDLPPSYDEGVTEDIPF